MSHNKERRTKRDEKLDKKSQAMEELKAEREKKKTRTGLLAVQCLSSHFHCHQAIHVVNRLHVWTGSTGGSETRCYLYFSNKKCWFSFVKHFGESSCVLTFDLCW